MKNERLDEESLGRVTRDLFPATHDVRARTTSLPAAIRLPHIRRAFDICVASTQRIVAFSTGVRVEL